MFVDWLGASSFCWMFGDNFFLAVSGGTFHDRIHDMINGRITTCLYVTYFWCTKFHCWFFSKLPPHSHWDNPWSPAWKILVSRRNLPLWAWNAFWNCNFTFSYIANQCRPRNFQQSHLPVSRESHGCWQECCKTWQLISGKCFHGCIGNQVQRHIITATTDHVFRRRNHFWRTSGFWLETLLKLVRN